ncbi:energy-coupling factor ABC transporter ATP-binding protein [Paenibacillus radicis (ex Xue et al. 2023)]|uniref:Energy-coupling factor ABC transporter ATP-binding protein n=1 Tax=Paenibacillus radicis (ex Xue et al. 2023) TaxID=2972489 RepID=A0ABT1YKI0_9BACL|nr:energy-coupling factor ABC transporter ATP-binding protein [Paenibacillus radicis (ex Xue et al. 2023)]MCR8633700.1 energy-coupling factor ABC transporter ATP-binding protein [Paenibacillus radicis (ex Xue et al. 2023)]
MNIELAEVSFSYERRSRKAKATDTPCILEQVNIAIRSGEMLAVAGKSGSGKSTFMQLIKGFLKPTFGNLLLDETNPFTAKRPELFDRVGFIFQYPEHQLFSVTVAEDVAFGLRHSGYTPEEKEAKVKYAMEAVGLDYDAFAERSPFELSGGEKRRVAIAGVVVLEPEMIILDEPTAGLDYPSRTSLFDMLHRLNKEQGTTILWVSHQLEEMLEHASRLLIIKDGTIVADGSPQDLLSNQMLLASLGWEKLPALELRELLLEVCGIEVNRPYKISEVAPLLISLFKKKQQSTGEESLCHP